MTDIKEGDLVSYRAKTSSHVEFGCVTSVKGDIVKMKVESHYHHEISDKSERFSKVEKIFG